MLKKIKNISVVIQSLTEVRLHLRPRATSVSRALTSFFQRVAAYKRMRQTVHRNSNGMEGMDLSNVARHV